MTNELYVIVGLGASGLSCAQFLHKQGIPFAVTDTRTHPPQLEFLQDFASSIPLVLGSLSAELLSKATTIVLSPGISKHHPALKEHVKPGVRVIGDIELFAEVVTAPVLGITGTNAKSTVTTLVGLMAEAASIPVKVGGNLGTPALDLLKQVPAELFVLELSSFQLETTYSLQLAVGSLLNISPDHMDRYNTLEEYRQAKQRIYQNVDAIVCNFDDPSTDWPHVEKKYYFTLNTPKEKQFGLIHKGTDSYLAFEAQPLLSVKELPVRGLHYQANALAALAIGYAYGLPMESMLRILKTFHGLPHRCQFVRELNNVYWFNDSKGTNVGATVAAILGLGPEMPGKIILIAGGIGKNADFSPLLPALKKFVSHVVLIGEAASQLSEVISAEVNTSFANTLEDAVAQSKAVAKANDSVLLSPACASFDMFKDYVHRGEEFMELVKQL